MTKKVDKDENYMKKEWGTQFLSSEYGWEEKIKALEVPMKPLEGSHFSHGYSFYGSREEIRNDEDYDDWDYGTEPIPHDETWTNHSK
jgi:hypothetical protein